jgi:hypothetical protein
MYGYYYADFMSAHPTGGFVLSEAQYAFLLSGVEVADKFLDRLSQEFRRDYAQGGRLRPDILGFCVTAQPFGYEVLVELLEVTTRGQMASTFKEDVLYKLTKFKQIVSSRQFEIIQAFSATKLAFNIGPSKWKPRQVWQRVVPLPLRTDEKGTTYIEWICFQPTFRENNGAGIDGLLLYEIHSLPLKSPQIPKEVLKRIAEMERKKRQEQQIAYGITLTPWLTTEYLNQNPLDRDPMMALLVVSGIASLALLAVIAAPVVAGLELGELFASAGLVARAAGPRIVLASAGMLRFATGLQGTMQTAMQWMNALGRQLAYQP